MVAPSAVSAVRVNGELKEWFKVTVSIRQGCSLSPYLFKLLLEVMMIETLKATDAKEDISGERVSNLRFSDDIDLIAETTEELQN